MIDGPSRSDVAKVLAFLPYFASRPKDAYTWQGGEEIGPREFKMPYVAYAAPVLNLERALYDGHFIRLNIDWTDRQKEAFRYVDDPTLVESADLDTLVWLFTTHIRKDRFVEGHLADMIDSGHILALLSRLKVLADTTQ